MKTAKMTNRLKTTIAIIFAFIFFVSACVGGVVLSSKSIVSTLSAIQPSGLSVSDSYTSAKAMCVMEASTGRVLYGKNRHEKLPMASTTKIMTAITAIENCSNLDERFEISPRAVGIPGTSLYLRKGETLSIRELLYGLMLISGNDASFAIGERIGGNVENFIDMMNKTAQKIGALSSHFDNTHGLDSQTHYTTAEDLAKITSYAMQNDTFREIVSTKNTKIVSGEGKTRYLKNKNRLLNSLNGCNGVKTGFTNDAGRCLVSSAERDGMNLVCVVLNCGPMFEESSQLLEKGFNEFKLYDLTNGYNYKRTIKVQDGRLDEVRIGTEGKFLYPLKESELDKIEYRISMEENLVAPVKKGQEVGKVEILIDNNLLFEEKIYTMEEVRGNTIWNKIKDFIFK